jgi:diguanylate cyclase (GGDEF)-like protein/PAS domain S-box-containing protein
VVGESDREALDESEGSVPEEAAALRKNLAEADSAPPADLGAGQVLIGPGYLVSAAVEEMPDGIVLVDMEGRLAYANRACERLLGYTASELIGRSALDLPTYTESKDKERAREILMRVIGGEVAEPVDMNVIRKDGAEVPVNFTASVIRDAKGDPSALIAVIRDISERKRAEEALRGSEEHYAALVRSMSDAVFKFSNGEITWCNEAVESIYGYKPEELIGKNVSFLQPLDTDAGEFGARMASSMSEEGRFWDVARVRRKDGSVVDVEYTVAQVRHAQGEHPEELVAVARDITERCRMEEALRESEELSRAIVDTAAAGIYLLQDGRFKYVNRVFEVMSGYTSRELVGTISLEYVQPDDRSDVRAKAIDVLRGESSEPYEYRFVRKDGDTVWVQDMLTSIDYRGERAVLGTVTDITERKRIETEVLAYTRQVETLFSLGAAASQTLNLAELLDTILDRVLAVMGTEAGGVFLADEETGELVLKAYRGVSGRFAKKVEGLRLGEGFTRRAAQSGKPLIVDDVGADPRLTRMGALKEGLRSLAVVPILAKDEVVGVIGVASHERKEFADREIQLLGAIASQVGMAIENAQLYERALTLAFTDGLTGLYNRRYLMEQIERELNRVERTKGALSLVMIDLDGLKGINDRYGHYEGDGVLRGLGAIIRANTRGSDVAARWGGDEFMLLAPDTDGRGARRLGERIRAQVERNRPMIQTEEVAVSISVGIASYPGHAADVTQLLQRVDEAMYRAKGRGRNQLCVFSRRGRKGAA